MNSIHREIESPTEFRLDSIGIRLNPMKKADPLMNLYYHEKNRQEEKNRNRVSQRRIRKMGEEREYSKFESFLEYVIFFFCSVKIFFGQNQSQVKRKRDLL